MWLHWEEEQIKGSSGLTPSLFVGVLRFSFKYSKSYAQLNNPGKVRCCLFLAHHYLDYQTCKVVQ